MAEQVSRYFRQLSVDDDKNTKQQQQQQQQQQQKGCPFADVNASDPFENEDKPCPFHQIVHMRLPERPRLLQERLRPNVSGGTFLGGRDSARLLADLGGGHKIREMTTRFYARAFRDETLDKFMFEKDGAAMHGQRLGDWIVEKMGGEGDVWTDSGRGGQRAATHAKAWRSRKRPKDQRGQRFKLDDCRAWMRVMFWAGRDCGLDRHRFFWQWYVDFIGHFIAVYERSASRYAIQEAEWSADKENIDKYLADGCRMKDIIGVGRF